jgi:hypothetical protein
MLTGHLGVRKFSRGWELHELTDDQKQLKCQILERLLNVLRNDESAEYSQVTRAEESWFSCHDQSTYCYLKSRAGVPPTIKTIIATKRALVALFFTGTKLLALSLIPRKKNCNQNYVLVILMPESSSATCVHGQPSVSHAHNNQEYFDRKTTRRVSYLVYSPELSPCDVWLFAYAKEQMKDQVRTDEDDL